MTYGPCRQPTTAACPGQLSLPGLEDPDQEDLSTNAGRLLELLRWYTLRFAEQCHPGIQKLADHLKVCGRTIRRCLAELRTKGLLTVRRTGRASLYRIAAAVLTWKRRKDPIKPPLSYQAPIGGRSSSKGIEFGEPGEQTPPFPPRGGEQFSNPFCQEAVRARRKAIRVGGWAAVLGAPV